MVVYQISGQSIHSGDLALFELLANIYNLRERSLCLRRTPGIEAYVAKVDDKYLIKRMSNSGSSHAPACDSYEPPSELSGFDQVIGPAIQKNLNEDIAILEFDSALSKGVNRSAPAPSGRETDSVKTDSNKLILCGTLHYLWEEASFNRWVPAMTSKRSWYVIRKYLLQAAEDKITKGANLAEMLYTPESFNAEKENEITQRQLAQMTRIATPEKGIRRLVLVIGEMKEPTQLRCGHRIALKRLSDCHFTMNDDIYKGLLGKFEVELGPWDVLEGTHLIMIGTFSIGTISVAPLKETAPMCATESWISFESTFKKMTLDALTQQNRRPMKGTWYNLSSTRPPACAVASGTEPEPAAMYVVPPGTSEDYAAAVNELIAESKPPSWEWVAGEALIPAPPVLPEHGR